MCDNTYIRFHIIGAIVVANTVNVQTLMKYMNNDMNVLIEGYSGLGKTEIILEAVKKLNLNMKFFNAPTIDPYAHLVWVPTPNVERDSLRWLRSTDFQDAEVVFIDEINRADDAVINAVYELIQYKSINGDRLKNLKCVMASMNPSDSDDYNVNELDLALQDRFNIYISLKPSIDRPYFVKKYGKDIADFVVKTWEDYELARVRNSESHTNKVEYLPPRRMDKIVENYLAIPERATVQGSIPPRVTLSVNAVYKGLREAVSKSRGTTNVSEGNFLDTLSQMKETEIRKSRTKILKEYENMSNSDKTEVRNYVSEALQKAVGVPNLVNWGPIIFDMSKTQISIMTSDWHSRKVDSLHKELIENYPHMTKTIVNLF